MAGKHNTTPDYTLLKMVTCKGDIGRKKQQDILRTEKD
jgi:hypothetical protein